MMMSQFMPMQQYGNMMQMQQHLANQQQKVQIPFQETNSENMTIKDKAIQIAYLDQSPETLQRVKVATDILNNQSEVQSAKQEFERLQNEKKIQYQIIDKSNTENAEIANQNSIGK